MIQQIEQKQSYLRDQIVSNEYDPEEFVEFCEQKVGNVDIQSWTFAQLKNIVKQFVEKRNEAKKSSQESSFMKYQLQTQDENVLDIDEIDIHRAYSNPKNDLKIKNQIATGLKHSLSMEDKPLNHQQSSIWGPQSKATVTLENIDQYDINTTTQANNNPTQTPADNDDFGDFSTPINQKSLLSNIQQANISKQQFVFAFDNKPSAPKVIIPKQTFVKAKSTQLSSIFSTNLKPNSQIVNTDPQSSNSYKSEVVLPININKAQKVNVACKLNYKSKLENYKPSKNSFSEKIPCIKAKVRSLLSQPSLSVQVQSHQVISRSFVLPSYVLYKLSVKPLGLTVKRKYAYFLKLRLVLSKFYPGIRLPYLQKGAWLSETGIQQIKMQKLMIQGFLNDILMNEELRNCRILEQFLTITDNNVLKQKFVEYEKMNSLKCIEQMCLLQGSVNVCYSDQHQLFFQKFSPFLDSVQTGIQKYTVLMQKLSGLYQGLIKVYTELEQVFVNIDNSIDTFKSNVDFSEFDEFQKSLKGINDHYRQLNTNVRIEFKFIDRQFKSFWTYESSNIGSIREILDIRTKLTDYYLKNYSDNPNRYQQYLNNKKLDQFKVSISQITKNPAILRYQMGFYNEVGIDQSVKLFNDFSQKLNRKIIWVVAERYLSRIKDLNDFYKGQKKLGKQIS